MYQFQSIPGITILPHCKMWQIVATQENFLANGRPWKVSGLSWALYCNKFYTYPPLSGSQSLDSIQCPVSIYNNFISKIIQKMSWPVRALQNIQNSRLKFVWRPCIYQLKLCVNSWLTAKRALSIDYSTWSPWVLANFQGNIIQFMRRFAIIQIDSLNFWTVQIEQF